MTNFEKIFKKEMNNPEFRKEFQKARFERLFLESLNEIRFKIEQEIPKKQLLFFISKVEKRISQQVIEK
jgi:hypothetical protein